MDDKVANTHTRTHTYGPRPLLLSFAVESKEELEEEEEEKT